MSPRRWAKTDPTEPLACDYCAWEVWHPTWAGAAKRLSEHHRTRHPEEIARLRTNPNQDPNQDTLWTANRSNPQ